MIPQFDKTGGGHPYIDTHIRIVKSSRWKWVPQRAHGHMEQLHWLWFVIMWKRSHWIDHA